MARRSFDVLAFPLALLAGMAGGFGTRGRRWFLRVLSWRSRVLKLGAQQAATDRGDTVRTPDPTTTTEVPVDPTTTTTTGGTTGATVPGGSRFALAASQVEQDYQRYSPPTMMAVAAEYRGLSAGLAAAAAAIGDLASYHPRWATDPRIADHVFQVQALVIEAVKAAGEVYPQFRALHKHDLDRHEVPRAGYSGEAMWNIGGRRGDGGGEGRASRFQLSCEQVRAAYANWNPEHMFTVEREYAGLPVGLESLAASISVLALRSRDAYPVDQRIGELIGAVVRLVRRAASVSQELVPLFRRVHSLEISHNEQPRNGVAAEAMWNV
jgi:hypothetical protein